MTYEYLRAAECANNENDQVAYSPCDRSYFQDYAEYRQIRDEFVKAQAIK